MKKTGIAILVILSIITGCNKIKHPNAKLPEIEEYVLEMLNTHNIPSVAIAVINHDSIIHKGYYGEIDIDTGEPINENTVFKTFSLTKTFVAVSVFKLIEEGKLSLTDKLSSYFYDLPADWHDVTIANLLSHSSGIPNITRELIKEFTDDSISDTDFIKMLYDDKMEFTTGKDWNYNQTNYIILKILIEKLSGETFENFVIDHQFNESLNSDVTFSSNPGDSIPHLAKYYGYNKDMKKYERKQEFSGKKNYPLAGMVLRLDEYIEWNRKLDKNELISGVAKNAMWIPFEFTNSSREFLHGWDVYKVNNRNSYGFSGGGVSGFRKFLDQDLTIIVLTTGYKYYSVQDIMIEQIAGIVDESLRDERSFFIERIMKHYFLEETDEPLDKIVPKIKTENPDKNLEEVFKSIGHTLFFQMERKDKAIKLFKINIQEHPESYDTYGSLGQLYYLNNEYQKARPLFIKALELNPQNSYYERRIKEIDKIVKEPEETNN